MRMAELVGLERPLGLLQRSLLQEHISNAYLFVGEEGIGKATAAEAFARALLCRSPQTDPAAGVYEACGRCRACILTAAGNHPHLRLIAPEGERIKIEQMRDLRHDVSLTAFGGERRAYVILDAEAMTEESANCILKTLEEPPPGVTLILVTQSLSRLLPTIISRCQVVRFRPAPIAAVTALLAERFGKSPQEASFIANFSGGRVGAAIRAAQQPAILTARAQMLRLLRQLAEAESVFAFRAAEEARALACSFSAAMDAPEQAEEENGGARAGASSEDRQARLYAPALLDIARSWFRDLLVIKLAGELPIINLDSQAALQETAGKYSAARLQQSLAAVSLARRHIARNANVSLTLEALMARLIDRTGEKEKG